MTKVVKNRWAWLLVGVVACLILAMSFIEYEDRQHRVKLALVIGNQNYLQQHLVLENPINDATAVDKKLRQLGFSTQLVVDLTKNEFHLAIKQFMQRARKLERQGKELITLVYYAGHGIQFDRVNYLVPVDNQLMSMPTIDETNLESQLFSLKLATDHLATLNAELNIVILDACRDLPIAELNGKIGGWADVVQKDFFVAFGTAPGAKALDGGNRQHGLFTQALLEQLEQPGLSLSQLFQGVRKRVMAASNNAQIPQESNQARIDLILHPESWWHGTRPFVIVIAALASLGLGSILLSARISGDKRQTGGSRRYLVKDLKLNKVIGEVGEDFASMGRADGVALRVEDPDCFVSRVHCQLRRKKGKERFGLRESTSSNGTYLDWRGKIRKLKPGKEYELKLGQIFYLVAEKSQAQARPFSLISENSAGETI